jgi:hypothetical protein
MVGPSPLSGGVTEDALKTRSPNLHSKQRNGVRKGDIEMISYMHTQLCTSNLITFSFHSHDDRH